MNRYTENEKCTVISRYNNGESVADLVRDTQIPRSTIYAWIKEMTTGASNTKPVSLKDFRFLENKAARFQGIIEIMKKPFWRQNQIRRGGSNRKTFLFPVSILNFFVFQVQFGVWNQKAANPHKIRENEETSFVVQTQGVQIAKDVSFCFFV